jgi:hypothetical protein
MKKLITLFAIAGMVLALAPAAQAQTTLMDPSTNDGSFEGYVAGAPVNWGNNHYEDVWANNAAIGEWNTGGNATYKTDGNNCMVVNGGGSGITTSSDLLGTAGYNTVSAGDEFTYSWDYRPNGINLTFKFEINFGSGLVELGSITTTPERGYQYNMSGTYTADATDASGGSLQVVLSQMGHAWSDNAQLSVVASGPAATPGTLIYGK